MKAVKKYVQSQGAINHIGEEIKALGGKSAFIILDGFSFEHFLPLISKILEDENIKYEKMCFTDECTYAVINSLAKKAKKFDLIVAVGGGKVLDVGKACAQSSVKEVVIVPTSPSTDGACSAISVVYNEKGNLVEYLYLKKNPALVIVDTNIIASAPIRLFCAGIGDAVSTFPEARGTMEYTGVRFSPTAMDLAKKCNDYIFKYGEKAVEDMKNGVVSENVDKIIMAIISFSCEAFENTGLFIAHAINNVLTQFDETNAFLHGEKVSMATCVQHLWEGKDDEARKISELCKKISLPYKLSQLNFDVENDERLHQLTKKCIEEYPEFFALKGEKNEEILIEAFIRAESL